MKSEIKNLLASYPSLKLTLAIMAIFSILPGFLFVISGCGSLLNGDNSATIIPTYTINGTIISPGTKAPLANIICDLIPDMTAEISSKAPALKSPSFFSSRTTTDQNGNYSFTGIYAGKYRLITSGTGVIPISTSFQITSDTQHSIAQFTQAEWKNLTGSDYDPAKAYITVYSDAYPFLSHGGEDESIAVELKKSGSTAAAYDARGNSNPETGVIDWTAAKTSDNGMTFFKGAALGQAHSITAEKAGYNFESAGNVVASAGEITHVILKGTPVVDGFPVTLVNNSGYKTEEIYLAVIGQDQSGNYYYLDQKGTKDMVSAAANPTGEKFCFSLSDLDSTKENTFQYIHPFKNMYGGRLWMFFKTKGVFGIADGDTKKLIQPDHMGNYKNVIFDKIELTCNGSLVTLNTTLVDYLSIGFKLKFNSDNKEKGFNIVNNKDIPDAFEKITDADWKNCVIKDDSQKFMRVMAPKQIDSLSNYFSKAIDNGWEYYSNNKLKFSYSGWNYEGRVITEETSLKGHFVVTVARGSKSNVNDSYDIASKPSSKVIWDCDGAPLQNSGTEAQKNLHACITAAINRGVFCDSDWSNSDNFYKTTVQNAGKYNLYSKILHDLSIDKLVYGFPYDDHFGKDPTFNKYYSEARKGVTVTIPKM